MEYLRLCGIDSQGKPINKGKWIPYGANPFEKYIDTVDKPYYLSTFIYSDKQFDQFKKTDSIAGFTDVTTDKLYWDFDSEQDLQKAKDDAQEMCKRLIEAGISENSILVCFSGLKGFSVEIKTSRRLKPDEVRTIAIEMAGDLDTFDGKIYDSARILRVPETKHQKSGLYKTPLHAKDLVLSVAEIKKRASNKPTGQWIELPVVKLPEAIESIKEITPKERKLNLPISDAASLDFNRKPKGFSNCKFAIMSGFFPDGERHDSLMILAATCRANGFPEETAQAICKAAVEMQSARYGSEAFPEEEIENSVKGIYGPHWNGGQYTCKTNFLLQKICAGLGHNKCKYEDDNLTVEADDVFSMFKSYAENYEKNTIKTGIVSLDKEATFMIGTSNGILAPPGVGKTSLVLSILNNNSKNDLNSIFFSYDMYHSLIYLRLVQKHFGIPQEEIFKIIKNDPEKTLEIRNFLKQQYKNVNFCFKAGQTPEDIARTITQTEEKTGKKVKLVAIDYNELVIGESSDPTQNSAQVAQKLRQIANDKDVCVITLLQPSKLYSDPSEQARTYQAAKGSGAIAQSMTLMLSLSRPGFNPECPSDDKFFSINAVKNRFGPLFSLDFSWNGLRGSINDLDFSEQDELKSLREKRHREKQEEFS